MHATKLSAPHQGSAGQPGKHQGQCLDTYVIGTGSPKLSGLAICSHLFKIAFLLMVQVAGAIQVYPRGLGRQATIQSAPQQGRCRQAWRALGLAP